MEMYYLVQAQYPDGSTNAMMKPEGQIIRDLGYRDCSDTEYEVYDVSSFGKIVKLEEVAGSQPNHHCLVNPETGETVIEGFSPEH